MTLVQDHPGEILTVVQIEVGASAGRLGGDEAVTLFANSLLMVPFAGDYKGFKASFKEDDTEIHRTNRVGIKASRIHNANGVSGVRVVYGWESVLNIVNSSQILAILLYSFLANPLKSHRLYQRIIRTCTSLREHTEESTPSATPLSTASLNNYNYFRYEDAPQGAFDSPGERMAPLGAMLIQAQQTPESRLSLLLP